MSYTYSQVQDLVSEQCCNCGVLFAMPSDLKRQLLKDHGRLFYCPNGHRQHYVGPTAEEKLRLAEAREQHLKDQLKAAEADAEQVRVQLVRDRHRFANGVCPCCNRSFENVARHIQGQHPDYDPADLTVRQETSLFRCSCGRSFQSLHGLRIHQGRLRAQNWTDPGLSDYWRHLTVTGS